MAPSVKLLVFLLSMVASLLMLLVERMVGIDWDFHPDSVTYATLSKDVALEMFVQGPALLINNLYYVICALLDESVMAITALNIILFALTNVIIFVAIKNSTVQTNMKTGSFALIALILLNPYRLHLSTTLLKDTIIIFLFIWSIQTIQRRFFGFVFMPFLRAVGILYYVALMNRKKLFIIGFFGMCAFAIFPDLVIAQMEEFNNNEMQFREFDTIPTFQDAGLIGSGLRGLVWAILFLTGTFSFISPSLPYVMVALGVWMTILFMVLSKTRFDNLLGVFLVLFLLGVMVTGYSSYIRYAYPLLVALPLIGNKIEKV